LSKACFKKTILPCHKKKEKEKEKEKKEEEDNITQWA
jgi:hypothetical protein